MSYWSGRLLTGSLKGLSRMSWRKGKAKMPAVKQTASGETLADKMRGNAKAGRAANDIKCQGLAKDVYDSVIVTIEEAARAGLNHVGVEIIFPGCRGGNSEFVNDVGDLVVALLNADGFNANRSSIYLAVSWPESA
jgi:hypothetical protein